jgi:hypothetical protein
LHQLLQILRNPAETAIRQRNGTPAAVRAISRGLSPPVADDTPGRLRKDFAPRRGARVSAATLSGSNGTRHTRPGVSSAKGGLNPRLMPVTPRRGRSSVPESQHFNSRTPRIRHETWNRWVRCAARNCMTAKFFVDTNVLLYAGSMRRTTDRGDKPPEARDSGEYPVQPKRERHGSCWTGASSQLHDRHSMQPLLAFLDARDRFVL